MVYDFLYVSVSGVFAFNDMELSSPLVGRVFDEFAAGPNCVYPTALMMSGMWCVGLLCAGRMYSGMVWLGSIVSGLSSYRPSCSGCGIGWRWGEVIYSVSMLCLLKFVTSLLPRSSPIMSQGPPFVFWSIWCRSRKVMLCRLALSLAVCLQLPNMYVLFRGDRHFVHVGVGPCFLLHMYAWTPQATSRESLRALYGAVEYPWMLWSAPDSALALRIMVM